MRIAVWLVALLLWSDAANARVVINEIFYNAPEDVEDLEYVELHNTSDERVDLSNWSFTKGLKYKFPAGAHIEPNGFIVLCRSEARFKEFYSAPVAGVFEQSLSNKGERLELVDATGHVVDKVKYDDSSEWPKGADGESGSLERICPNESGELAANWASSPLSEDRVKPAGTPGVANANYSAALPPVISEVKLIPQQPKPDESIRVEATIQDQEGGVTAHLRFRLAGPGYERPETIVPIERTGPNRYVSQIPGQGQDQLIRLRIEAIGGHGARRFYPAEHEPRPALSIYVSGSVQPGAVPFARIINTTEAEMKAAEQRGRGPSRGGFGGGPAMNPREAARGQARMALQSGIDLASAWFEITVKNDCDLAVVQQLKPVFAAKGLERDKIIDDLAEASNIEERLGRLPDVIKTFRNSLLETLKPQLAPAQQSALATWAAEELPRGRGGMPFGNPRRMVKTWVNLEAVWYAISVGADMDPSRFEPTRALFRELAAEREEIAQSLAKLENFENGFREIRDRADHLSDKVTGRLKPLLSAAQEKQLQDLQRNRNPLAGGPGAMRGPPEGGGFRGGPGGFRRGPSGPTSHRSAFVYFDPETRRTELFDFVQVVSRSGGQKVRFAKDQPLRGMSTINLLYENDTALLVEPLAYEVYRRAGMATLQSYHVRLWQNNQLVGFYALVEQPNRTFLRRNGISDDGNLYKILWYERGVVGQHEKKTHTREGHDDVVSLIESLQKSEGEAQWQVIQKHFDVPQVATYFAVNTVLSHWDGFFNNYFTYHDTGKTGLWTMYPWDQDNTWGVAMGRMGMGGEVFYNMPITFGMNGDVPPGQRDGARPGRGFGFGGGGAFWWRQPGYFSGPLLANPQFRKVFLTRTREILESVYTEETFGPVIDRMADRLRPEIKLRAELMNTDPNRALQSFEQSLQALREHIKKRREFLLAQDEIKNAAATH